MRGYDRYDYDDLDEYEEDGEDLEVEDAGGDEYEHEEEEEEEPKPTKDVLDYLELRQRLKEQKRKELKKESGTVNGSLRDKKNSISRDSYGSFFGPSQPVIAQRVIQESKSLLESASLARRVNKPSQSRNKSSTSSLSATKSQSSGQKPKVTNGQKKVEILKNTRDYSFLLSDDTEVPVPKKVPLPRNISAPKPEARPAQLPERNKGSLINSGRKDFSSREKGTTAVSRLQPKVGTERMSSGASQVRASTDSKKHVGASNGTLTDRRKQLSSSNGSGPGWPVMTKAAPAKVPVGTSEKKVTLPVSRNSAPSVHKAITSKSHQPVPRQSLPRREEYQVREKPKVIPKQTVPAPKPKQVIRPPQKDVARDISREERPRKRPVRHDDDDDPENAISMIRSMFGYNPRRYEDVDDDSDMEANFDDIMREEKRSARIARLEDEEELRKIEEEERRERLRKEGKRRKLSNR